MTSSLSAAADRVVTLHYTLTLQGGQIVDQSGDEPLSYLHGHDNIVPGLESQLEGKAAGAKLKAVVSAADGYGENSLTLGALYRAVLYLGDEPIELGMQFVMEDKQGDLAAMWVVVVEKDHVVFDLNHPLAGEILTFDVEVLEVRDATAVELEHGHVHGPHDHHHH